jgi:GT2 family glycosyltransferase
MANTIIQKPGSKVKIAITITTFGRPKEIASTLIKIRDGLLNNPYYKNLFVVQVINNDTRAKISPIHQQITVHKNPNLGGSGGFARGLYEASKDPGITHCLFMDDDASCDIESIIKTYKILSSSDNPNLAIAGCMTYEHKPSILSEAGAKMLLFDVSYKANKQNLDLTKQDDVSAFHKMERIDYGGWWFYAFPIMHTPYYPFPFFVRGDDILFGLMNPHEITIDIDIRSAQLCFSRKFTPWVTYLVFRASFVHGSYRKKHLSPALIVTPWH